jgi:hypothetical protein
VVKLFFGGRGLGFWDADGADLRTRGFFLSTDGGDFLSTDGHRWFFTDGHRWVFPQMGTDNVSQMDTDGFLWMVGFLDADGEDLRTRGFCFFHRWWVFFPQMAQIILHRWTQMGFSTDGTDNISQMDTDGFLEMVVFFPQMAQIIFHRWTQMGFSTDGTDNISQMDTDGFLEMVGMFVLLLFLGFGL